MANYGFNGWAKISRSIMADPMYHDGEFDKAHALIDLMLLADSTASVQTSLKALKTRWSWGSERRVRHFLESVSASGIASVKFIPNKGVQIRINAWDSAKSKSSKKSRTTSVSTSVSTFEETFKEVGVPKPPPASALESLKEYREIMEELEDE